MPRAPKQCHKIGCSKSNCRDHGSGWRANSVKFPLPPDWSRRKQAVLARDAGRCQLCQGLGPFEVDHILARSQGGSDDLSNLRLLCLNCHAPKSRKERGGK